MARAVLFCLLHLYVYCSLGQVNDKITIDRLHIRSDIRHRFSETLVTSKITNNAGFPQDVTFDVRLPNEAFISGYSMLIDDVVYPGRVQDKAAGERRFNEAVRKGESAGKVSVKSARETNDFTVTVNVAAVSHVTFNLTYQELLQRRLGLYEHVIHINPGEVIPDFRVEVYINESRAISELTVPEIRGDKLSSGVISGNNKFAQIISVSPSEAQIIFSPTPAQQREYSDRGVSGQFIVNYDVDRNGDKDGEILVADGYFVHFLAPESLPTMGKRIMFVLDTSGSMRGRKIQQLREAMKFILRELRSQDEFGIVLFSSSVTVWDSEGMLNATKENVDRAVRFTDGLSAGGGTNINAALIKGLESLSYHTSKPSMILFLTDGQATSGITSPDQILTNVKRARHARQSIYSLAFGSGADFELLQKISAQNQGFARKIFEDADAAIQLAGFYNEISSPLLSEVIISYLGDLVNKTTVTRSSFTTFFRGSEIIVAGRYSDPGNASGSLDVVVKGSQSSSHVLRKRRYCIHPWYYLHYYARHPYRHWYHPIPWPCPPPPPPRPPRPVLRPTTFIERLWVYLTIKQLVGKQLEEQDQNSPVARDAKSEALNLSLKYNFVTPYTTMVATKPKHLKVENSFGPSKNAKKTGGSGPTLAKGVFGSSGFVSRRYLPSGAVGSRLAPSIRGPPTGWVPPPAIQPTTTTASPVDSKQIGLPSGLNVEVALTTSYGQRGFLCLDIVTSPSASDNTLVLLNDTVNNLLITGTLHVQNYDSQKKFQSVSVIVNETEVIQVSLKSVIVRGTTYRWWQLSSINENDVTVFPDENIEFRTSGNISLVFHKYGLLTRRSLSSPFIIVDVKNTENVSPGTTGAVGNVLSLTDARIGAENRLYASTGGLQKDFGTTVDKLRDGTKCHRLTTEADLLEILDL